MNPFKALENIQEDYKRYVFSFQKFKNPAIRDWIEDKVREGTLLWKDPHIQLNRNFKKGDSLQSMVDEGLLHKGALDIFTVTARDKASGAIRLYKHQSDAVRTILEKKKNTIVSTGTGSGKSFCFGIPIVNTCLKMKEDGLDGIKAIIIYPMNALANSQYEDFSKRLHGTGLKIALYTGDTETSPDEALRVYKDATGRDEPYDSEILSREKIQAHPPDILMTNYVMLDLIFSRFDDKTLFPSEHYERLKYLVLDEIHTYTGQKGADVACLTRRVKQRTDTIGKLRCIGTSATVQAGEGEDGTDIVAKFAQTLFAEPFEKEAVIGEIYEERSIPVGALISSVPGITDKHLKNFKPTLESAKELLSILIGGQTESVNSTNELGEIFYKTKPYDFIRNQLEQTSLSIRELTERYRAEIHPDASFFECMRELLATLLIGTVAERGKEEGPQPIIIPKIHTFFSQGRTISSCLTKEGPHLNDRGETVCPECSKANRHRITFPLNFCRACGQEYYGATRLEDGTLRPRDIDTEVEEGENIYIFPGLHDEEVQPYPEDWYEDNGKLKSKVKESVPKHVEYCPECNRLDPPDDECFGHTKIKVSVIPRPFLFCPSCGVYYDRRVKKEFNKLFTFGSVGRSTATDVLLSATLEQLPEKEKKIIAFSDNRQDTALQASHINNLQKRIHFRRGLYQALIEDGGPMEILSSGSKIFKVFEKNGVMPRYSTSESIYTTNTVAKEAFMGYLLYNVIQDLRASQHKNQQNLEDVGLIKVSYMAIDKLSADDKRWSGIPEIGALSHGERQDLIQGFLDIFRKQQAIKHSSINNYSNFKIETINKLNEGCLFHIAGYRRANVGYSDTANSKTKEARVLRITTAKSRLVLWVKKILGVDIEDAKKITQKMVELLAGKEVVYLVRHKVKRCGDLYMVPADIIILEASQDSSHKVCRKCGSIYHFDHLNYCIEPGCLDLEEKDLSNNYFRTIYSKSFDKAVRVEAEEHSGQIAGTTRKDIENRFKDPESSLNTIICTPTMELGIDIGALSSVYMRNVPPSPSNYAQRSGRAGRKNQPSIITTFCGVGTRRGPHDQYFYKYPDKIISGMISPPRFMLDNKNLIRTHLHSLILEEADTKFYPAPREILDMDSEGYPMFESLKKDIKEKINANRGRILDSVKVAFKDEMKIYEWFDEDFVSETIDNFVEDIDNVFDYWRIEYEALVREWNLINVKAKTDKLTKNLKLRRDAIEGKFVVMKEGKKDFYTYSYLRSRGFLPSYGFPTSYASLSLSDVEDEIVRDKVLALYEFAPGNTLYFRNQKYNITRARPRTEEHKPVMEAVLICPICDSIYLGSRAKSLSACQECGQSFEDYHPNLNAMELPDMYGSRRERITSDEEERVRLGYNISLHYEKGKIVENYIVDTGTSSFNIAYEHNGKIIIINKGTNKAEEDGQEIGFVFCNVCNQWLFGKKADKHTEKGGCRRNANEDDIIKGIYLFTRGLHDVVTLDIPAPKNISSDERDAFYLSVKEAILQGIQISLNVEASEIKGVVKPDPRGEGKYKIIIFENAEGGIGVVKALTDKNRLLDIFSKAREILHEGDENGCKKACYECLLSYYNQIEHALLDRHLALDFLNKYKSFEIKPVISEDKLKELREKCGSGFEEKVLEKIVEMGLPIPDDGQKIIYDKESVSIAQADFFYKPNITVFVDGPDHEKEHVAKSDKIKRDKLRALGYTVVSIKKIGQVSDLKKYMD